MRDVRFAFWHEKNSDGDFSAIVSVARRRAGKFPMMRDGLSVRVAFC